MNRFRKAWLALSGKLEPEVREVEKRVEVEVPVIGEAHLVKLYRASQRYCFGRCHFPPWNGRVYLTCEQAHVKCPGAEVSAFDAVMIGRHYFSVSKVEKVQPKPKVAKGKRAK